MNSSPLKREVVAETPASSDETEPSLDDEDHCAEVRAKGPPFSRPSGGATGREDIDDDGEAGAALEGAEAEAEAGRRSWRGAMS